MDLIPKAIILGGYHFGVVSRNNKNVWCKEQQTSIWLSYLPVTSYSKKLENKHNSPMKWLESPNTNPLLSTIFTKPKGTSAQQGLLGSKVCVLWLQCYTWDGHHTAGNDHIPHQKRKAGNHRLKTVFFGGNVNSQKGNGMEWRWSISMQNHSFEMDNSIVILVEKSDKSKHSGDLTNSTRQIDEKWSCLSLRNMTHMWIQCGRLVSTEACVYKCRYTCIYNNLAPQKHIKN